LTKERKAELEKVCEHIAQSGKGITACDEGPGTIGDRFAKFGIENSEEARRKYRQVWGMSNVGRSKCILLFMSFRCNDVKQRNNRNRPCKYAF
jgi:fructose-bisphosphate aldolase class 1